MTGRKKAKTWIASGGAFNSQTFSCCRGEKGIILTRNGGVFYAMPIFLKISNFCMQSFLPIRPATKTERMRECLRSLKQNHKVHLHCHLLRTLVHLHNDSSQIMFVKQHFLLKYGYTFAYLHVLCILGAGG
jgi:hypothetical protein